MKIKWWMNFNKMHVSFTGTTSNKIEKKNQLARSPAWYSLPNILNYIYNLLMLIVVAGHCKNFIRIQWIDNIIIIIIIIMYIVT